MSPEQPSLLTAMLAVQSEATTLPKDAINPAFRSKYTPLDTIVEHVGPILAKHRLVWTTMPGRDEHGEPALHYRLAHADTGEALDGSMPLLLAKEDSQGMGSAITYARRYCLCAVLNLVADEDDDGNAGSQRASSGSTMGRAPATDKQKAAIKRELSKRHLTTGAIRALFAQAGVEFGGDAKAAVEGLARHHASAILDTLKQGPVPSEQPSDVPGAAEGEFTHAPAGEFGSDDEHAKADEQLGIEDAA